MKNAVKNTLESYIKTITKNKFTENEINEVLNAFTPLTLHKNDFFTEEGKICPYFCFIESGILQHSITILGEEKTTYLSLKNSCTSALKSFINAIPSRKNIKALSNCELWVLNKNTFNHLLKNNTTFKTFYFNLIENQIFLIDDYRINLLILTPEERYKKLLTNEPKLLQEVPLHYLASFLGISPRHVSRIRKNIK